MQASDTIDLIQKDKKESFDNFEILTISGFVP